MKPKLLIVELWGLGDLVIATPFIQAAAEKYELTLLSKPYAQELGARFWPQVKTIAFDAPWTAFTKKYHVWRWPVSTIAPLVQRLTAEKFEVGLSARWDPRDHLLLKTIGARKRLGFPRMGSQIFLTQPLPRPDPALHRYESWRTIGASLGIALPRREELSRPVSTGGGKILIHTGAKQSLRVWPLENFRQIVRRLREQGHEVLVACDPAQRAWWFGVGEQEVITPSTVTDLFALIDQAAAFIGNDSGPGHIAAFCGVPTFTFFGPQLPEWFAPLHPQSEWIEGKACPYKPCSDYCRFSQPHCLTGVTVDEAREKIEVFLKNTNKLLEPA